MFVFGLTHRVLKAVPRVLSGGWLYANTIVSLDFLVILYDTAEGKLFRSVKIPVESTQSARWGDLRTHSNSVFSWR